jgi:hypothetical protein
VRYTILVTGCSDSFALTALLRLFFSSTRYLASVTFGTDISKHPGLGFFDRLSSLTKCGLHPENSANLR